MAREQPNHRHNCPCNTCVRRRNARRRQDADRYAGEGRPLPPRSQFYEVERDLPPVYDGQSAELQEIADAVRARGRRSVPPMIAPVRGPVIKRPAPAPIPQPVPRGTWGGLVKMVLTIAIAAVLIGAVVWWQHGRITQLINLGG